jgi:hypothetical protein
MGEGIARMVHKLGITFVSDSYRALQQATKSRMKVRVAQPLTGRNLL